MRKTPLKQFSRNVPRSSRNLLFMSFSDSSTDLIQERTLYWGRNFLVWRSDASTWDVNPAMDAEFCLHGLGLVFHPKRMKQDELSKAPDVNNGRRHNKQPLLSYHSVLTSNNKKKCCKYSWLFDFCSSIAHILHNSFQFRRPFVFLLTLPSHRDLIYHVWVL